MMTPFSLITVTLVILTCLTCSSRSHVLRKHPVVTDASQIESKCPVSLKGKLQGYFGPSRICYEIGEQGPCSVGKIMSIKHGTMEVLCVHRSQPVPPTSVRNVLKSTVNSDNVLVTRDYHALVGVGANRCGEEEVYDYELESCV